MDTSRSVDIASLIARFARETPGRAAFVQEDRSLSWKELDERVSRAANLLIDRGMRRGDRVAVLGANTLEYVEVFFGVLRAACCAVPLPTMASPEALSSMLRDSGSRLLFAGRQYRDVADQIGRAVVRLGLDFEDERFASYQHERDAASSTPPGLVIAWDDAFDVIYSSGTTGVPKGIVHSHGARKASYAGSRAAYFSSETVNVIATPFYSNTTCVTWFLTLAAGGTSVVLRKFSPEAFLEAVQSHRATHAMLVPVQYERILDSERFARTDIASLKYLFSTSAPLRAVAKTRILSETPAELVEIYGLTEGGPVTVLEARRHPDKLASVGQPVPGCSIRILDENGVDVAPGQAGEVVGRSSNMMSGYLNRPEETAQIHFRDANGDLYFRSGDVGRFDPDGFLYLLDRKKDVIISGGFNVYATDLEIVLGAHPSVSEVAVIGVPSERWGETPLALVVLKPERAETAEALRDFCNERVGKAQRVSAVELRAELPKSAIGKILKRELREPYWAKVTS